ncbi:MAG: DUF2911 domain-containing protein [Ferruginibacter sp.]|nr:DUF2911 domain-containing protein [Ferruginibacter sp.]
MFLKKIYPFITLAIVSVLFYSCNAVDDKKTVPETKNLRLPVSVQDSLVLSLDKSPMDMSYYPADYPKQKMVTPGMANPVARVIYSRPQKNGRIIFADSTVTENVIQHYGHEWRLGANEATEIEFFKEVAINGKKIAPGRYILYCLPYPDKWKMIINQNLYSWGLHIDKTKDIAETDIPVNKTNVEIEYFTMLFQQATGGCNLVMSWGDVRAVLPITFQ